MIVLGSHNLPAKGTAYATRLDYLHALAGVTDSHARGCPRQISGPIVRMHRDDVNRIDAPVPGITSVSCMALTHWNGDDARPDRWKNERRNTDGASD